MTGTVKQLMLPANRAFDSNGFPSVGATASLYLSGTTTPALFYSDSGLTTSIGSTITANSAGRFTPMPYQDSTVAFRLITRDAEGNTLDDVDPFYFGSTTTAGPMGPAGDISHVTNRTALAAITGLSDGDTRYLIETGREGNFVWSTSNHATDVTNDPNQGLWVAPASDTTGASGAWIRRFSGRVNVKWFGAKGDGSTDDSGAFVAALNYLHATSSAANYANGTAGLFIPYSASAYYMGTTTLDIRTCLIVEGESVGEAGGAATHLKWAAGATGIRIQGANTSGDTATQPQDNSTAGAASIIRNLYLEGGYNGSNAGNYHGIHLRSRASIRDCTIVSFQGDGIHIACDALGNGGVPVGNANNTEAYKLFISGCGNGIYLIGGDCNAGVFTAIDALGNRLWGISDNSFLGNTYIACHTATNGSGPYQTTNTNARNVFIGCYAEGDQTASQFVAPTVIIGGLLDSAGVTGSGAWLRNATGYATFDNLAATNGSINNLSVNTSASYQNYAPQWMYSGFNGGDSLNLGLQINTGGAIGPGIQAKNTGSGAPLSFKVSGLSLSFVYSGDAGEYFKADNTGVNIFGAYKVSNTTIINASGVLQAAGFPALTGDVTTSAGSLATTVANNAVTYAKFQQVASNSIVGNPTGSLANAQGITLGATLTFSGTALQTAAHTGDVTTSANSFATTIAANAVTYAKFQQVAASSLVGNPTGSLANAQGITLAGGLAFSGTTLTAAGALTPTSVVSSGAITSSSSSAGVGYSTGAGGTVTQVTSRTTGVTINKPTGAITLVSAAGSSTWATFTVTNSTVAATDTVEVVQKSGANLYSLLVTAVAAGSFNVSVSAVSGTATEAPVLNFTVTKGVTA